MQLHDLYINSIAAESVEIEPPWAMALAANFGSVEGWKSDFCSRAKEHAGVEGWMLLAFQPGEGTLVNRWVAAGDAHVISPGVPLLAVNTNEHGASVDAFVASIDWHAVYVRYQAATDVASEAFGCDPDALADAPLVDVRRAGVFERAPTMIAGARWRDPQQVASWAKEFNPGQRVNVYCVYGHEVGRATALRLRAAGVDARFVRGGISEWEKSGGALEERR